MKTEIRPYNDSPAVPPTCIPLGPYALDRYRLRNPETAAPADPKPKAPQPFFSAAVAPKRIGREVSQDDSGARRRQRDRSPVTDMCPHTKWERQGKEGTKRYRYQKCARCGKSRTVDGLLPMGRPRQFPKVDFPDCDHPLECRVPRRKLTVMREWCKQCDHFVPSRPSTVTAVVIPSSTDSGKMTT